MYHRIVKNNLSDACAKKKNRYHKLSSHFTGQFFRPVEKFERILQYFRSVHTQLRRPRSLNFERHTYNTLEVSTGRQFVRGGMGGEGGGRVNVVNVQQKSTKELADIRFMS